MPEVALTQLWLPILLSAVIVFVASAIAWMLLPHHRTDWKRLPEEDAMLDAVRRQAAAPGQYAFPNCRTAADMKNPAIVEKWKQGPWGSIVLLGGPPNMGKALPAWFAYLLVVSLFVAYVAKHALAPGAPYLRVFQIAGAVAFLAYAGGAVPKAIWEGRPASVAVKDACDGLVYALLTAGVFGWLWPHGATA
jgi:hypothetical protein